MCLFLALASSPLFAQVPDGFSYQAVLRDNQGAIMANQAISLRLSILDAGSTLAYQEVHDTTTSEFGLITLVVGQGSPVSGTFGSINWETGSYFMEIEVDETGGSTYTSLGSFQLLTVPFAMYANKAMDVDDADADSLNEIQSLSIHDDTLALSDGGFISLSPYVSKWNADSSNIYYEGGFVGINITDPIVPLHVVDSLTPGLSTAILAQKFVTPSLATDWQWGMFSIVAGEVSDPNHAFRAIQGNSAVNNIGGIQNWSTGLAGFADSAFSNYGVVGRAGEAGDATSGWNRGVWGIAEASTNVNRGVEGNVFGDDGNKQGVYGLATGGGTNNYGVEGRTTSTGTGFNIGVRGAASGAGSVTNYGIFGVASNGSTNYAGYFNGDVQINGTLSKSGGTFKIDHPLDPTNQYLVHSFVESPDMLNVYNGNITTDGNGFATVSLPEYFEAANKDFKYQLTVIGTFAQAIIAEKLSNNQFVVQTDQPNVEVSWQITGVRNDPWADANRVQTEVEKTGKEAGKYLHPSLYGQPASMGMPQPESDPGIETPPSSSSHKYLNQRNK